LPIVLLKMIYRHITLQLVGRDRDRLDGLIEHSRDRLGCSLSLRKNPAHQGGEDEPMNRTHASPSWGSKFTSWATWGFPMCREARPIYTQCCSEAIVNRAQPMPADTVNRIPPSPSPDFSPRLWKGGFFRSLLDTALPASSKRGEKSGLGRRESLRGSEGTPHPPSSVGHPLLL